MSFSLSAGSWFFVCVRQYSSERWHSMRRMFPLSKRFYSEAVWRPPAGLPACLLPQLEHRLQRTGRHRLRAAQCSSSSRMNLCASSTICLGLPDNDERGGAKLFVLFIHNFLGKSRSLILWLLRLLRLPSVPGNVNNDRRVAFLLSTTPETVTHLLVWLAFL